MQSTVLHLFNSPPELTSPLEREPVDALTLVAGKGIEGHKFFGQTRDRQINLMNAAFFRWFEESFQRATAPGSTGENVVLGDEFDLNWLRMGQRLRLGTAELELRTYRQPCKTLARELGVPKPEYFVGHVGILCEVVKSGQIAIGDSFNPI